MSNKIELAVQTDIMTPHVDVVALHYDGRFTGDEWIVANELAGHGFAQEKLLPESGTHNIIWQQQVIKQSYILIVGTKDLSRSGYLELQDFAKKTCLILKKEMPNTNSVAITLPTPEKGLDDIESFNALFVGFVDSLKNNEYPVALNKIVFIVEKDKKQRINDYIIKNIVDDLLVSKVDRLYFIDIEAITKSIVTAKTNLLQKDYSDDSRIFVAMPFKPETEDIYFYGIQGAVRSCGMICERIDQDAFVGDILTNIKSKIAKAGLVIAVLDSGNSNVYLELGYAWGKDKPTILISKDTKDLFFDVRGQKCIIYSTIQDLEKKLQNEILGLRNKDII